MPALARFCWHRSANGSMAAAMRALISGLVVALLPAGVRAEDAPHAASTPGTQLGEHETPLGASGRSSAQDAVGVQEASDAGLPRADDVDAGVMHAGGDAAPETEQTPPHAVRAALRSSRRSAAWHGRVPAEPAEQPLAVPRTERRKHQGWISVARSAPLDGEAAGCCPRCGHAISPSQDGAAAAEEAPVISGLGGLLRGLLGLPGDARPVTETLAPGEPAAVLWDVRQRLAENPLEGTIFSEPDFSPAKRGIWGGVSDDSGVTFVQWIRKQQAADAAAGITRGATAAVAPRARPRLAAGGGNDVAGPLAEAFAIQEGASDSAAAEPDDVDDQPALAPAADRHCEEVRAVETLPPPHSAEDLVECLRKSSRQLEIIAHDLERHRVYDPADELRYMAAKLRREARRHTQPEQFAPDEAPDQPADGDQTTTAQTRLRNELRELRQEVARLRELLLRAVGERMGSRR